MTTAFAPRASFNRPLLLAGACGLALALPIAAHAQVAEEMAEPAPPPSARVLAAEDGNMIVVTATKREQTLQEIPVAVTVTTAETIERAQIRDIKDLSSVVPSLRISQLQSSANTNFFIRGFGNGANNAGIEPSVGVFVDGVYRSRIAASIGDFPDIQRVEVLRGPQSTLFGKNASAGVISFVTRKPQFDFGGNIEASYGNYNAILVKGLVTGPLTESVAVSLAGGINKRDGYIFNPITGNDINERDRWFVRGQALFEPDSDLSVRLIGDYEKIDEICCAAVNLLQGPRTQVVTAPAPFGLGGRVNTFAERFDVAYSNFDSTNDIENWGVSGQVEKGFGPLRLTSITAYRRSHPITNQDSDFTSADLLGRNFQDLRINTFTQELRLATDIDGPLNALIGAFYFNEKIDQNNSLLLGNDFRGFADRLIRADSGGAFNVAAVEQLLGAAAGNPALYVNRFFGAGQGFTEQYSLDDESYSFFGQLDFEVTDRLTLTGGINYTKDKKTFATNVISSDVFSNLRLNDFVAPATNVLIAQNVAAALNIPVTSVTPQIIGGFAAAQPAIFNQIATGSAAAASQIPSLAQLQFLPPFLNVPNAVEDGRLTDDDISVTARLAYDVTDRVNVYLSYATGYKPASVNLSRDSRPLASDLAAINAAGIATANLRSGSRFAQAEQSTVYEAGLKADWGLVSANLAVFKQEITGFQSNIFTGTGFLLASAGKQSTFGIEFEGTARPVPELALSLAMTYLNPKYDSFPNSAFGDASGQRPAGVPPISATFGASWEQPLGDSGNYLILRGDFHYEAPYITIEGLPNFLVRNPVTGVPTPASLAAALAAPRQFKRDVNDLNASVTLALANGLELSVWGRNLLDERYIVQIFDPPAQNGSISGYPNQPRTYGVAARFRF